MLGSRPSSKTNDQSRIKKGYAEITRNAQDMLLSGFMRMRRHPVHLFADDRAFRGFWMTPRRGVLM